MSVVMKQTLSSPVTIPRFSQRLLLSNPNDKIEMEQLVS